MVLRSFVGKMKRGIKRASLNHFNEKSKNKKKKNNVVPHDVGEGYFVVHAVKGEETKRFIVELEYLNDPEFMVLLDQAHHEFGYSYQGALSVPCSPQELQKVLEGSGGKRRMRRWSIS